MNIITKYQANEISKKRWAETNAEIYAFLKEEYEIDGTTREVVDGIFNKIREDSELGFFESIIEISFANVDDDVKYYKDYSSLLERSFNHLGYVVESIPFKNELRLFVSWD